MARKKTMMAGPDLMPAKKGMRRIKKAKSFKKMSSRKIAPDGMMMEG
jgi:hypothetical protein